MNHKYELTKETKVVLGITLYRIKALISFGIIDKGTIGGWIEKEENLSHKGNAWVSGNARVYGDARVSGRFNLTVNCDFNLNRINIDTEDKLNKLKKFLEGF